MRSLAAALALGAALSFAPVIHADNITGTHVKQVEEKKGHHTGTISKIDGETLEVSMTNKTGEKKDHKIKTDSNTKVTLDGKEAKLSDLKEGQTVSITPGAKHGDPAAEIEATSVAAK